MGSVLTSGQTDGQKSRFTSSRTESEVLIGSAKLQELVGARGEGEKENCPQWGPGATQTGRELGD